jgi:hypothetical protein
MVTSYSRGPSEATAEFVMVAVPTHRVLEVYALLGSSQPGTGTAEGPPAWSDAELRRLLRVLKSELTPRLLAHLAARPDDWVSIDQLVAALGTTAVRVRGSFSGLTRTIKANFGRPDWPLDVRSKREGHGIHTEYRVDSATASVIQQFVTHSGSLSDPDIHTGE